MWVNMWKIKLLFQNYVGVTGYTLWRTKKKKSDYYLAVFHTGGIFLLYLFWKECKVHFLYSTLNAYLPEGNEVLLFWLNVIRFSILDEFFHCIKVSCKLTTRIEIFNNSLLFSSMLCGILLSWRRWHPNPHFIWMSWRLLLWDGITLPNPMPKWNILKHHKEYRTGQLSLLYTRYVDDSILTVGWPSQYLL